MTDNACGEGAIQRVEFEYRRMDQDSWWTLPLTGGPRYSAVLDADFVEYPGIAWRIRAGDWSRNDKVIPSGGGEATFEVPWHSHADYPNLPPISQNPGTSNPQPPAGQSCAPATFNCRHDDERGTSNCCETTAAAGVGLECDANFFGGTCIACGLVGTPCGQEVGGCCTGLRCGGIGAQSGQCGRIL